ncbi:hexokinase A, partial [Gonapodya sp. JEL0774]
MVSASLQITRDTALAFIVGSGVALLIHRLYIFNSETQESVLSPILQPRLQKPHWLQELRKEFTIGHDDLAGIVRDMLAKFGEGLGRDGAEIKMLPSYVRNRPTGREVGKFYALDFGGTNFRVCELELTNDASGYHFHADKFKIPEELKLAPGEDLFDFFGDSVLTFITQRGLSAEALKTAKLGFTFSFPIQQLALNKGILMQWNKGFDNPGVIGKDVVELLHKAFDRKGIPLRVTALVNDTVGTLVANGYKSPNTTVGVIVGTGTNAAYWESVEKIQKWDG